MPYVPGYMYSGMADVAALRDDSSYINGYRQDMGEYRLARRYILPAVSVRVMRAKLSVITMNCRI